ncbi:hypothetical protein F4811DRAFT_341981 [Daldinia bambusicola]|nr:hypothetical protein F4811DRAFT_341981 [Daldinia bambusicola]
MNKLPQELMDKIVSLIPKTLSKSDNPLRKLDKAELIRPGLATLSTSWQAAIEYRTFECLTVRNTELTEFVAIFSGIRRRQILRKLRFVIVLPTYSDEDCGKYETNQEREVNNILVNEALSRLLHELSTWPACSRIRFELSVVSPMDWHYRGVDKLHSDKAAAFEGDRIDVFGDRYRYSNIRLINTDQPQVPCIQSFTDFSSTRALDSTSWISLMAKFPAISTFRLVIPDPWPFVHVQKKARRELAVALEKTQISPETQELVIEVEFHHYPHWLRLPDLTDSSHTDLLCAALNNLIAGSNLQSLHYQGPIHPSFFWSTGPHERPSSWASITEMSIEFYPSSPSGQWYFKGSEDNPLHDIEINDLLGPDVPRLPPGYGTKADTNTAVEFMRSVGLITGEMDIPDPEQQFREIPDDEVIVPLLEAFARRLAHMPSLQYAELSFYTSLYNRSPSLVPRHHPFPRHPLYPPEQWTIYYSAPGKPHRCEGSLRKRDVDLSRAHVSFELRGWMPDKHLVDLFRNVGKAANGEDAIITFLQS